jgi:alcohol dehydrogenase (cytochrome c)
VTCVSRLFYVTAASAAVSSCAPIPAVMTPAPSATVAAASVDNADWPGYNRTLAGDRYSPLAQINPSNVANLQTVCSYRLPEVTSLQTGPIVISGMMYFTTDTISYAIDAATCAEKWKQVRHSDTPGALAVNRGFAYMDGRLFRGTSDAHVIALDAKDGRTIWDHQIDMKGPGITIPMAPVAANGLVFAGNAGGDQVGVTGHVYALDAKDGHVVWRFDVVPSTPAVTATWPSAPHVPISGGAFWTSFTYDAANGILYVPSGNPAPDFDIDMRRGDNLYTNSVIAIDASNGQMLAYNQLVKHDIHDWDVDSPPALATTRSGKMIVASSNKNGLLSVLERSAVRKGTSPSNLTGPLPLLFEVPTTTRTNVDVPMSRTEKVRFCPGITGGTEWNGAAYDPHNNTLYTGAVDWCVSLKIQAEDAKIPEQGQTWLAAATAMGDMFDPVSQASGWVTAVDADNGSVRWKYHANSPILAGVTPTAGGLVFTADMKGNVYGFDATNGKVLWQHDSGQSTGGGVITYGVGGRQLLAVASGMKSPVWPGGASESRVVVFGLK